VKIEKENKP